jgi:hypothetical protein
MDHPTKKSKGGTFSAAVVKSIHGEGPNMYKEEIGICVRCGDTTHRPPLVESPESDLCHGCWKVESRLEGYLKNPKARSYVEQELAKAYKDAKEENHEPPTSNNGISCCGCHDCSDATAGGEASHQKPKG